MSEWSTKKERTNIDLWAMTSDGAQAKADSGKGMYGKKKDEGKRKNRTSDNKAENKRPVEQKPKEDKPKLPPKEKPKGGKGKP